MVVGQLFQLINSSGSVKNRIEDNIVVIADGVDEDGYFPRECMVYDANGNSIYSGNKYYNAYPSNGAEVFKNGSPYLTHTGMEEFKRQRHRQYIQYDNVSRRRITEVIL